MRSTISYIFAVLIMCLVFPESHQFSCNPNGDGCVLMRNVLRDPLRLSNWKPSSFNRAINQLQAYQKLFQEDKRNYGPLSEDLVKRRR